MSKIVYICKKCGHKWQEKTRFEQCPCGNFVDYIGCDLYRMQGEIEKWKINTK